MRILLDISYIGTNYCGWQSQINGTSVQTVLEAAVEKATGRVLRITGASRTDAGVHARCMRAHMPYDGPVPAEKLPFVINRFLPEDIRVTASRAVPESLHARFQAVGKQYTYRIDTSPHPNALTLPYSWHYPHELDVQKMNTAAHSLLGTHDFTAFAASGFQSKSPVKSILKASVTAQDHLVAFTVTGSGFLYNMVRIIAGTLAYIGQGKLEEDCIPNALKSLDRLDLGPTAPPEGLELTCVYYSRDFGIPDIVMKVKKDPYGR